MNFSDMMQGSRGPGLIGMFLALMVMLGFGLLFIFASDEGLQGGGQTIQAVISQQKKEIESLRQNISSTERTLERGDGLAAIEKELAAVKKVNQGQISNMNSLKMDISSGNEAITAIEKEFEDYKNQYRTFIRAKAKGRIVGHLVTRKGEVFENVVIKEVTSIGLQIRHDGGLGRIPYEVLPDAMLEEFQFDPGQKIAAVAKEVAIQNEHESAVSASKVVVGQKASEQKIADAQAEKEQKLHNIEVLQTRIDSLKSEIANLRSDLELEVRQANRARSSGHIRLGDSSRIHAEIQAKQNQISALQTEVFQLQAGL